MEENFTYSPNLSFEQQEGELSMNDIFDFLWRIKVWIIIAVLVSLVCAYFYLKTQTRTYERTAYVMLNKNKDGVSSQLSFLAGIDISGNKQLDDQVFILQSPSMMQKVVERLDLNTRYYYFEDPFTGGKSKVFKDAFEFKQTEFYGNSPFSLSTQIDTLYPLSMRPTSIRLEFVHNGDSTYTLQTLHINGQERQVAEKQHKYSDPLLLNGVDLSLSLKYEDEIIPGNKYLATWTESFSSALGYLGNLKVAIEGSRVNRTDIIRLNYTDVSTARAADITNTLVIIANDEARKYKSQSTLDVLRFIDSRLADIEGQLKEAERGYKEYQASRALINSNSQANLTLNSDQRYKDNLTEIMLQLEVLEMIYAFMIETPAGTYRVVPSYLVVSDSGLSSMITKYNDKVIDRERMVFNSSEINPKVLSINTELNSSKKGIELSLENLIRVYTLRKRELEKVLEKSREHIADIPEQQLKMQELSRKVEVIEPLYLMLQKKKEETQIAMYEDEDLFRVIEAAYGNNAPVSPNSRSIYLIAFVLGFCVAPGIFFVRTLIRNKVETKYDVEKSVDAPILAVLPRTGAPDYVLLPRSGRDQLSESFRMFRSNVQSLPNVKLIQVTSSVQGEGKSFISSNLALSLAYVGKKVLLVGMDLRNPSLPKIFPNCDFDRTRSLVGYLIGKTDNVDDIIIPSGISHHMDIIFSGITPPDPTVLLSGSKIENLIDMLKTRYDYIILDSTPYFPVTDSSIINKHVDSTLYVVRCDYTSLKFLKEMKTLIHRKINPLRNANIVMNGFNAKAMKYRYSFGEGYGFDNMSAYGYTYGNKYGYGYGHTKKKYVENEQDFTNN